jgi:hypothetical protein
MCEYKTITSKKAKELTKMANHRMPRKRSTLNRTVGVGLVAGGMALGGVALTMMPGSAPEANAACGSRFSAFSNTGTNNPNTLNFGSGNNLNFQGSFTGGNVSGGQTSSTGNNSSTNAGNTTVCTVTQTPSLFPSASAFSNTGTNNPNTFNVLSGNNVNVQFGGFGPNFSGGQSSSTGNNNSTNTWNKTVSNNVGP